MMLIYNLTEDKLRDGTGEERVRAFRNLAFINCEQILTEQGICYISNSFLSTNLSAKFVSGQSKNQIRLLKKCNIPDIY